MSLRHFPVQVMQKIDIETEWHGLFSPSMAAFPSCEGLKRVGCFKPLP
jgi:hypothetical protein